jgi:preprotein translocase subunit SecG
VNVTVLLGIVLVVWLLSGIALTVTVLLHSGKGTGLSDIIAGSVYSNTSGTGLVQKNLDRITVVCAVVFFLTLLTLMLIYPQGYIVS